MLQEMTLKQVIDQFNEIALKQPVISTVLGSGNIYDLNEDRNAKFGVFCLTQGTHSTDLSNGFSTYNFFLYYVDRLQSNESNKIEIQSTALETLKNILRTFIQETDSELTQADFQVFTESFAAVCAGAYATISIIVEDNNCIEKF